MDPFRPCWFLNLVRAVHEIMHGNPMKYRIQAYTTAFVTHAAQKIVNVFQSLYNIRNYQVNCFSRYVWESFITIRNEHYNIQLQILRKALTRLAAVHYMRNLTICHAWKYQCNQSWNACSIRFQFASLRCYQIILNSKDNS